MQRGGGCSCPNLKCQTLLTFHESPYPLGGIDGGGVVCGGDRGHKEEWKGELWLEYEMKKKK